MTDSENAWITEIEPLVMVPYAWAVDKGLRYIGTLFL